VRRRADLRAVDRRQQRVPRDARGRVAGIATGLVATGRGSERALVREAALVVERDGAPPASPWSTSP
jgi:hypothetical protein